MTISMKNEALVDTFLGRRKQVVAVVDPYSTGCLVAQEIAKRGYLLICVYSEGLTDVMKGHVVGAAREVSLEDALSFSLVFFSMLVLILFYFLFFLAPSSQSVSGNSSILPQSIKMLECRFKTSRRKSNKRAARMNWSVYCLVETVVWISPMHSARPWD